jgi:antibiotic biosynthesis monooxygenase (ABM) superfamily enzyme
MILQLVSLVCFAYKEAEYEVLLDQYEALSRAFPGWTLSDIRSLSFRERSNWLERAIKRRGSRG